jgi:hypothetical protein
MSVNFSSRRNDVRLLSTLEGEEVAHFRLREFANAEGLAMVHPELLLAVERVRRDLNAMAGETVWVIVKDSVRTEADLARLAARLGWSDEGGSVSRDSMHLAKNGGIAVDLIAVVAQSRHRVPQTTLGDVCRRHFDFVKDDYTDGHVHADLRGHLD